MLISKLEGAATAQPPDAEVFSVRLTEPFLSRFWRPLRTQFPGLSASDLIKQALIARAALEAGDGSPDRKVVVKLFCTEYPDGVDFARYLGFTEALSSPEQRGRARKKGVRRKKRSTEDPSAPGAT